MRVPPPSALGLPTERYPAFRPGQYEAALSIATSQARTSVDCAPTGVGKSLVYSSAAALLGARTLVLVGTKALQDQNCTNLGSWLYDIRGHSNYPCAREARSDDAYGCLAPKGQCNYRDRDVPFAIAADRVQTNYAHWIALARAGDADRLGHFDLLVLDEAHNAHDQLVQHLSLTFGWKRTHSICGMTCPEAGSTIAQWLSWAHETRAAVRGAMKAVQTSAALDARERAKRLSRLNHLDRELLRTQDDVREGRWLVLDDADKEATTLMPIWGAELAEKYLFRGIPRVVLMSATVGLADAAELGLDTADRSKCEFREFESPFDVARRPLYYIPTVAVDTRLTEQGWDCLARRVLEVVQSRASRGLIHTHSYERQRRVLRHLALVHTESEERNGTEATLGVFSHGQGQLAERLRAFLQQPCGAFVSPSLEEGYDFADDLARYQIILKVPYLDGRDPITAARAASDKTYKNRVAARTLAQTYGRLVRSATDYGESFIFDMHFGHFRYDTEHYRWFSSAWRECRSVPQPLAF